MNLSGLPPIVPIAGLARHACRPPPTEEREKTFFPFLAVRNTFSTPYPHTLLQEIEASILGKERIFIDEMFFSRVSNALATPLQLVPENCSQGDFWSTIRIVRTRLDAASRHGYPEEGNAANQPPWCSALPFTTLPETHAGAARAGHDRREPEPLRQLALDCITRSLAGRDILADEIATHRIELKFALLHMHVAGFTHAVKQCRPDLWQLSGPLDEEVAHHVGQAMGLCDTAMDGFKSHPGLLLDIQHELSWASYYVGGTNWLSPRQPMTDSDMLGAIAVEHVYQRIAAICNGTCPDSGLY